MYVIEFYDHDRLVYTQGYFPTEKSAEDFVEQYDAGSPYWYQIRKRRLGDVK